MNAGPARRARRPYAATTTTGATAFEAAANTTSRSDADDDDAHERAHTRSLSRALHAAATRDEERIAELLATHACQHVYIDVGSNIGVQLRKLFEPAKYPKAASTHGVYERYFGPVGDARCAVCAIGIEPNPHHRPKLTNLQRRYRAAGVGALVLYAAASDVDSVAQLALGHADRKDRWEDLGASASEAWAGLRRVGNAKSLTVPVRALDLGLHLACKCSSQRCSLSPQVPVRALDLGRVIHTIHRLLRDRELARDFELGREQLPPFVQVRAGLPALATAPRARRTGRMVMKLDVEGLEFAILPSLVRSQALCVLDAVRIEWHTRFWDRRWRIDL